MSTTISYTVKAQDGYLSIARHIFSNSSRPYIQSLVKRYDLMKEVAKKLEDDLTGEYINFKLIPGQKLRLKSDPGYYIPRLALLSQDKSIKTKARQLSKKSSTISQDHYFVIHSTEANIGDNKLKEFVTNKKVGSGHAYINRSGDIFKIWPYNHPNGWATRAERREHKPELRGKLVNIELVYAPNDTPTKEQYVSLAGIYIEVKKIFNFWLPIAAHREIDRGIKGGHKDPVGFDFNYFYQVLKSNGVPISNINKQSQVRFNQVPWCEHKWIWPPTLSGTKFIKVSDKEFVSKGCK